MPEPGTHGHEQQAAACGRTRNDYSMQPPLHSSSCPIGSGPRYQILSHVFARCASQKLTAMRESHAILKNLWPCENRTQFSHGRRFLDSRNAQKSVTQIIYLGPLPTARRRPKGHSPYSLPRAARQGAAYPCTLSISICVRPRLCWTQAI